MARQISRSFAPFVQRTGSSYNPTDGVLYAHASYLADVDEVPNYSEYTQIGTHTYDPNTGIHGFSFNAEGERILSLFGKNATLYHTRSSGRTSAPASQLTALTSILSRYFDYKDLTEISSITGTSAALEPQIRFDNGNFYYTPNMMVSNSYSGGYWVDLWLSLWTVPSGTKKYFIIIRWAGPTVPSANIDVINTTDHSPIPPRGTPFVPSDPGSYTPDSDIGGGQDREPASGGSVGIPSLPTISSIGTGLLQLYNPSKTQLVNLGRYLWSNDFNLDNLKKIFSNPMDVILGLSIFPVTIPTFGAEHIMLGNLDSGISANTAAYQYVEKNFGTLSVDEYYSNYLDYDPYTQIEIFLPYIGFKTLSPDEVMGKTLTLSYSIDLLSGACVAHILADGKLTYEFSGVCNTQIPITSQNYTSVITGTIGVLGGSLAAGLVMASGMGAAASAAGVMSAGMKGLAGLGASTAASVMSMKHRYEHSGSIGSAAGYLAGQTPYVMITTPRWCKPGEQPHFTGYPGFLYRTVSQLTGYTIFVNLEVTKIHCTQGELDEIIDWFTNKGVRI